LTILTQDFTDVNGNDPNQTQQIDKASRSEFRSISTF
jgi:hypothetical protein